MSQTRRRRNDLLFVNVQNDFSFQVIVMNLLARCKLRPKKIPVPPVARW